MSGFGDFGQELNEEELFEQADPWDLCWGMQMLERPGYRNLSFEQG